MARRTKPVRKAPLPRVKHPTGFWDRLDPAPPVISVRRGPSKLVRSVGFLLSLFGWGRNQGKSR